MRRQAALWTPFGEALCDSCHGSVKWNGRPVNVPAQTGTDDEHGYCTKCGRPVWVLGRSDVALLTRVRQKMGGEMNQTGGMCAALSFERADGGYVIVTAEEDFVLGLYTKKGWEDSGEAARLQTAPVNRSLDQVCEAIRFLLDAPYDVELPEGQHCDLCRCSIPAGDPFTSGKDGDVFCTPACRDEAYDEE